MSLATQLSRGRLALPLLAVFALLGFGDAPRPEPAAVATAVRAELVQAVCELDGPREHALVLAQAPADLGHFVVRLRSPCRA